VARVCNFLRRFPSLSQIEQAKASSVECRQVVAEMQEAAQKLLQEAPAEHPIRQLLEIYAGSSQDAFEAGEDVANRMGRTWVEDVVYAHAWVFPDLRRTELGELLRAVARRRTGENIDDVDRVLFTVLTMDIPGLLGLLGSLPDRFPAFFVTHLVDVLYFAGRVPLSFELEGRQLVPPRDWHLIAYAQELSRGPREHQRYAVDYLRAGGSPAAVRFLEMAAGRFSATAASDEQMEEAVTLLSELGLGATLGVRQCRRRAQALRADGDVLGSLRWACRAEWCGTAPQGYFVSELLDGLAEENLEALLAALAPAEAGSEPLERYPPESLLALLGPPPCVGEGAQAPLLPPSGRLFFFAQFARCRALRLSGQPASAYAPTLVRLLTAGVAPPGLATAVVEEELLPALGEEPPALAADEALLLMRYVQSGAGDSLGRGRFCSGEVQEELQRAMGACLSRALLCGAQPHTGSMCGGPPLAAVAGLAA